MTAIAGLPHLLVVDDDSRLRALLGRYLGEQGHVVTTAASADEARAYLRSLAFDLLVLDVMMPGQSGLDFARALRTEKRTLPILMLTARGDAAERIAGLEAGADDYLPKPFEPRELLLRIAAILRRAPRQPEEPQTMRVGRWRFDADRAELSHGGATVRLTDVEASLLRVLAQSPGTIVTRDELAERSRVPVNTRSVDVQVNRLRRKVEPDPRNPRYLVTVRGSGYVLRPY
jgi:two-component system, OmpR family, phosphate regulon response regulator OmpR